MQNTFHCRVHEKPPDHDKKRDDNGKPLYKNNPVHFTCPICGHAGFTIVQKKTTLISLLITLPLIFLLGIYFSVLIIPWIIFSPRYFIHKCPSCFMKVASYHKITSTLKIQDKVRKAIYIIFLASILCLMLYMKLSLSENRHHRHEPIIPIKEKWEEFLNECGHSALQEQGIDKKSHCNSKYFYKTVMNWRGYVIRVGDYYEHNESFHYSVLHISLKMLPSEKGPLPDVILALDSEIAKDLYDMILSLERGTEISFNAKIMILSDKYQILQALEIKKESGFMDVSEFVYDNSRFGDAPIF